MSVALYLAEKLAIILSEKDFKKNREEIWAIVDEIDFEFIFDSEHTDSERIALLNLKDKLGSIQNEDDATTYGMRKEAAVVAAYYLKSVIMRKTFLQTS
jgi:hypothetical protein